MLKPLFKTTNDVAPFILRVLLGAVFFCHELQKVRGWFDGQGLSTTADFLTQHLHIPILFAFLSIATDLAIGVPLVIVAAVIVNTEILQSVRWRRQYESISIDLSEPRPTTGILSAWMFSPDQPGPGKYREDSEADQLA